MQRSIVQIYAALVCFVTVVCFAIALGFLLYACVKVAAPSVTMNASEYQTYQSDDLFWERRLQRTMYAPEGRATESSRPPDSELKDQRLSAYRLAMAAERRSGIQTIIRATIICLIDILLFGFHWRLIRPTRNDEAR